MGELGELVSRECDVLVELEEMLELESERDPRLDTLLSLFVIVVEAVLKSDLAAEVVKELDCVGEVGESCEHSLSGT